MKIAFISAHNLIGIIGDQVEYVQPKKLHGVVWGNFDGVIIQLDLTPLPSALYSQFGGWTVLQQLFAHNEGLKLKPIILTSWNSKLIKSSRFNNRYGLLKATKLLISPLMKFLALKEIYRHRHQLISLFDRPIGENHEDDLLIQDLKHNLFLPSIIHEVLHQFKDEVRRITPFQSQLLVDRLVPQLYQYLNQHFTNRQNKYFESLSLQIERFHKEYLPVCQTESAFIYRLEQLENLIEEAIYPIERAPEKLLFQIIYIDDNRDHADRLAKVLETYGIICHQAFTQEEAEDIIERESGICAVLCDFRFYEEDQRIARRQGYHILENLQAEYKGLKYAFLSDRAGLTKALPKSLRWQWPEFRKWEIIDGLPNEKMGKKKRSDNEGTGLLPIEIRKGLPALITFLDLAEQGRQRKEFTAPLQLAKILNAWKYEQYIEWLESCEPEITFKVIKILRTYSSKTMLSRSYKSINSRYYISRKKINHSEKERGYLFSRILLRRLTLGMLQLPIDNFTPIINQLGLDSEKAVARWGSIYYFLSHGNVNEISSENVSKAFSKLGMLTSKEYRYQELVTKEEILPNEWSWLYRHGPELSKMMSN